MLVAVRPCNQYHQHCTPPPPPILHQFITNYWTCSHGSDWGLPTNLIRGSQQYRWLRATRASCCGGIDLNFPNSAIPSHPKLNPLHRYFCHMFITAVAGWLAISVQDVFHPAQPGFIIINLNLGKNLIFFIIKSKLSAFLNDSLMITPTASLPDKVININNYCSIFRWAEENSSKNKKNSNRSNNIRFITNKETKFKF